ncbi:hypothetical protein [Antiquaquibacter soli]|uniref:FtsX-like permease family protein n=1 Tax=Antiquaquibacter soli TaxID=3064523 RepID=A0ABT9BID7_9MICO|nr:hypothetical protein [Protaetiibacter sp. WY-16]MDO7880788.1 hypothetical protein [Protaetiibacter sp. WY-16]
MLAAIVAVVALLCGLSLAMTVYIDHQGTAGLRAELETRAGADLALRASFDLAEDAAAQDDAVRAALDRTFQPTGIAFDVTRSIDTEAYYRFDELDGPAQLATIPDLAARAEFGSGGAPEGPAEVAVQAVAAESLGIDVGDSIVLNDVGFTVSGTWTALDPLDPRWYGDDSVVTGGAERAGPFAVAEEAWERFESAPTATWTVVPRSVDEFTATNSDSVVISWQGVEQQWRGEVPEYPSLVVQGRLTRTLGDFAGRILGLRAIEPVAAVLVAGSALVVLSQLVQLLVATRERESALYWARGQSPLGIARRTAVEVGASSLLGAALGVGAVAAGFAIASDVRELLAVRSSGVIVPAVVVLGAIVFAGAASYRSVVSVTTPSKGGRGSARVRRAALPGVVVLVTVAAALAVWQLRLYGSPVTPSATGAPSIDPVAVVAPAAALIAIVLAALAAFPWIVRRLARRAGATDVPAHLALRTLARYTGRVAAPLVIVALAVGSATFAAAFAATWDRLFTQTADLHAGSDLRISSRFDPLSASELDAIAAADGVRRAAPFDVQNLSIGTVTGVTLGAAPDTIRELATTAGGSFSPDDAADAIAVDQPGPVVPEGTSGLELRVEAIGFDEAPRLTAWVADSFGSLRSVEFGEPEAEPDGVLVYPADASGASGTLLSIDVRAGTPSLEEPATFRLLSMQADGTELELDQYWITDSLRGQFYPPIPLPDGDGFTLESPLPIVRMTATFDGTGADVLRPGVVVTQRLADLLELESGDLVVFALRDSPQNVNAFVTGIVPSIPGSRTDMALLIDLAVTNHLHQRNSQKALELTDAWVTTDEPEQVRAELRSLLPANTRIDSRADPVGRQVLGAAAIALWAAAACCVIIAVVAVGSASGSRLRWGRNDIASLRAIGLSPREQSGVPLRELGIVLGVAAVAGILAGAAVTLLTVAELARAAVDRAYLALQFSVALDLVGWSAMLGAVAAGIGLVLLSLARRVRSIAATALPGEVGE